MIGMRARESQEETEVDLDQDQDPGLGAEEDLDLIQEILEKDLEVAQGAGESLEAAQRAEAGEEVAPNPVLDPDPATKRLFGKIEHLKYICTDTTTYQPNLCVCKECLRGDFWV